MLGQQIHSRATSAFRFGVDWLHAADADEWVKNAEIDSGQRAGAPTDMVGAGEPRA